MNEVTGYPFTFRVPKDMGYADCHVCVTFAPESGSTMAKCFLLHVAPYAALTEEGTTEEASQVVITQILAGTFTTTQTAERTINIAQTLERTLTTTVT